MTYSHKIDKNSQRSRKNNSGISQKNKKIFRYLIIDLSNDKFYDINLFIFTDCGALSILPHFPLRAS